MQMSELCQEIDNRLAIVCYNSRLDSTRLRQGEEVLLHVSFVRACVLYCFTQAVQERAQADISSLMNLQLLGSGFNARSVRPA